MYIRECYRFFAMYFQLLLLASCSSAATLPKAPFLRPCAQDNPHFNDCALESAKYGLPIVAKGDRSLGIPPLNPLHIPEVKVDDRSFTLTLHDALVYGLENAIPEKIEFNFEKRNINMEFTLPVFKAISKYAIDGKFLLLPIKGDGDFNGTSINGKLRVNQGYNFKKINGKDHMEVVDMKVTFMPQRFYLTLTNLFNGDKTLGDHMNAFLNENWKVVYEELRPTLESTFETILTSVTTSFFNAIPYEEILPKTL
ncbi:hypothetical protein L9F63_005952 [Diploptera punctata]|uniref:Protein takeout n=1 Tax=Diploptera punctata TaxID=6984 RepID=A0AAD8E5D4_DIPPU|nr:hypothetical protein L9F63_005952 [Diploptera punctata]